MRAVKTNASNMKKKDGGKSGALLTHPAFLFRNIMVLLYLEIVPESMTGAKKTCRT